MMERPPVFVYGSLKPGEKMFRHISHVVKETIPATILGHLYDTPFGYPLLLCPGEEDELRINGVILIPLDDMYDEMVSIIDVIEGEAGFTKEVREVLLENGSTVEAIVHLYLEAPPYAQRFFKTEWP
jgi:gamma-glutamylcyclotransferase (GGCT)/AIG2-like uncharacterized protein YtfP